MAVVIATTAYLFWPLWWGALSGAPRWLEWDVPEQYWPDLTFLCRSLHRGEVPLWNPYDRGGYPYYADPQAATYSPVSWGICALAGPSPTMGWAEVRVALGFLCAGFSSLLWLRRLGASWAATTLGAVVIECAPFMRHNWELNLTTALGWMPLVLWALERALQERRARDAALLAIAEALLVATGSPPVMWLAGSFTLVYAVARLVELKRTDRKALAPALRTLGLAVTLAIGLCAVVVVPGLTLAGYSVQAGRSYASIAGGGLTLGEATALFWPREGNHLYVGWIALGLTPLAFVRTPRLPGAPVLALLAAAGVLMSLGDDGPLFGPAFDLVPGVSMFRSPHRYEAWLGPAIGALAAGGLDAAWARAQARWPSRTTPQLQLAVAVLVPLLAVADATRAMPSDRHTRADARPASDETAARVLAHAPLPGFRVMDEFAISCRAGTRLSVRDLRGYQDPLLLHAYERALSSLREHPALAMQLNVRYALTGPHFIHGWDRHFLPPPADLRTLPGAIDRGDGVIELTGAMPLAYVVPSDAVEHVARREDALARTIALAPAPIAILEDGLDEASAPPGDVVSARVLHYARDVIEISATATSDAVLVVNETWYPGWRAEVDGISAEVVRANGLVRALAIPAGTHRVVMTFAPSDGASLRWLWLVSWLVALGLSVMPWARRSAA